MLRSVALVRTDISVERITSIIRVTRIGVLGTSAVSSNQRNLRSMLRLLVTADVVRSSTNHFTLMMEALRSSETALIGRETRRNIPEEDILQ
jgi:hypothetical protein